METHGGQLETIPLVEKLAFGIETILQEHLSQLSKLTEFIFWFWPKLAIIPHMEGGTWSTPTQWLDGYQPAVAEKKAY